MNKNLINIIILSQTQKSSSVSQKENHGGKENTLE